MNQNPHLTKTALGGVVPAHLVTRSLQIWQK